MTGENESGIPNMRRVLAPEPRRIPVGKMMLEAAAQDIEWYKPVMGNLKLFEEGGASEPSYKNLCQLIEKFGQPIKVERTSNGGILVSWLNDKYYFATGFEVGYLGTGPYYLALFGEKAGFGEVDDLYMKISGMDRATAIGVIWERS